MDKIFQYLPQIFGLIAKQDKLTEIITKAMELFALIKAMLPQNAVNALNNVTAQLDQAQPINLQWVQQQLAAQGFNPGTTSGTYDDATHAAVRNYQSSRGLTADGWVGPVTMSKLLAEQKQ